MVNSRDAISCKLSRRLEDYGCRIRVDIKVDAISGREVVEARSVRD